MPKKKTPPKKTESPARRRKKTSTVKRVPREKKAQSKPQTPLQQSLLSPKEVRLRTNLAQTFLQFMSGRRYQPLTQEELFHRLGIPDSLRESGVKVIEELLGTGKIHVHNNALALKTQKPDAMSGILRMHPKGFGFVIPDHPLKYPQDVFIPKHLTDGAVDGDHVEVDVATNSLSDKGPEGKIITILKRARTHAAGVITQVSDEHSALAYVPLLGSSKPVLVSYNDSEHLSVGDRVILDMQEWGSKQQGAAARLSHRIGSIEDPSSDIAAAIEEFDLKGSFPRAVIAEAKAYGAKIPQKELKNRINLSKEICFTIDPDTAKDFDDALSLKKDRKGHYHLGVHIADVAHYVIPGSALDQEAFLRGNSTYLPGTCIPMLPEELSNELCSLQPKKNRLTVSALMEFDKSGNLVKHEIVRSYINSKKRFTYFEAKDVLDGKKKSPYATHLKLMVELCTLLKTKRYERGSIDFSLPELALVIDAEGAPTGVRRIEYDITHQLVEEFMLKANEVVAWELKKRGKDLIYRVHEEPAEENIEEFANMARLLGFTLPKQPTAQDLQTLFKEAKESPYAAQLSVAFIRSMRLAQYSQDNIGHFGLALEHYCHFTSPIRRYSDLVVERLLFNQQPESPSLENIARRCCDQERVSFRAEMSVKTLKKIRLLQTYFKKDPSRDYPAIVTKIKPFGLFFELQELGIEGFIHISELGNDYFIYNEERQLLAGRKSGVTYKIADRISVRLCHTDLIQLETKWDLASNKPGSKRKRHRS